MVVDGARVAVEDAEIAGGGPCQVEVCRSARAADAVLHLTEIPLKVVQVAGLPLQVRLGLCLFDQAIDFWVSREVAFAVYVQAQRAACRSRFGPVAPDEEVDGVWAGHGAGAVEHAFVLPL